MKTLILATTAMLAVGASAHASIIPTLVSITPSAGDYTWLYQGTLAMDQGLTNGSQLVIVDFQGYVAGSFTSSFPGFTASVENTSPGILLPGGYTDNPAEANLVLTYNGPDYRTSGGPYPSTNFNLSAVSIYNDEQVGVFSAVAVKNNGVGPGGTGTTAYNLGSVTVPNAVPEPATWAMLLLGFGGVGAVMRSRAKLTGATAA